MNTKSDRIQAEKMLDAIGEVSNNTLSIMDKHLKSKSEKRLHSYMWQFAPMAAALVLLVAGTVAMFYFLAPDGDNPVSPRGGIPNEIVWLVEPTLDFGDNTDFSGLSYCEGCDVFYKFDTDWNTLLETEIIDETTGLSTGVEYSHHTNYDQNWWIHDRDEWKFGYIEWRGGSGVHWFEDGEFDLIEHSDEGILIIHQVDSSMVYTNISGQTWLEDEAFQGVFMSYRSDGGLTNYNCTLYANCGFGRSVVNVESFIDFNNKHGIVDRNNNVLIPFVFEAIFIISETSAFARVGDYWGILEIPPVRPPAEIYDGNCGERCVGGNHTECPPHGTRMKDGDRINDMWSVVQLPETGHFSIQDSDGNIFADGTWFDSITDFGEGAFSARHADFDTIYYMKLNNGELFLQGILLALQHSIFDGTLHIAIQHNDFEGVQAQLQLYEQAIEILVELCTNYDETLAAINENASPQVIFSRAWLEEIFGGEATLDSIFHINTWHVPYENTVLFVLYCMFSDSDSKKEIAVSFNRTADGGWEFNHVSTAYY
jgi:hypothetical protein